MERAESELEMAERHVREGERHVRSQLAIVDFLRRHDHPLETAEALLTTLQEILELHREHLARLKARAAPGAPEG